MFKDLFEYISLDIKKRNNYVLFAHNLSRFDSLFILKSLATPDYDGIKYHVNGKWKENDLLYIKITDNSGKMSITLLDSIKFIPFSLDKVLKSFNRNINKGIFPHKFMTKDNLNYRAVLNQNYIIILMIIK